MKNAEMVQGEKNPGLEGRPQVAIPRTNPPKRGRRLCGLRSFHWRAKGTSGEESKAAEGVAWVQPVTGAIRYRCPRLVLDWFSIGSLLVLY
jgi:hypothetical protein